MEQGTKLPTPHFGSSYARARCDTQEVNSEWSSNQLRGVVPSEKLTRKASDAAENLQL